MWLTCSGYGTNVEGPWDKVMEVRHTCLCMLTLGHWRVPQGRARHGHASHCCELPVLDDTADGETDIRIGTRTDRTIASGGNDGKVKRVEEILSKETSA